MNQSLDLERIEASFDDALADLALALFALLPPEEQERLRPHFTACSERPLERLGG